MSTNYEYIQESNLISIKIGRKDVKEFEKVEMLYFNVLSICFLNQSVQLITIQPQEYSLGFELSSPYRLKIDGKEILLNDISNCTSSLIKSISQSEEFNRGLLILALNVGSIEMLVRGVWDFQNSISNVITCPRGIASFCNYDGECFYLLNSSLSIDELKALKGTHQEGNDYLGG